LVLDQEDDLYQMELDSFVLIDNDTRRTRPGSSMISSDGIHPNEIGYEVWGRFMARKIIDHLESDRRSMLRVVGK
jgi:lysophospholipase L1-like esterase